MKSSLHLEWNINKKDIPKLPLQILETYFFKEDRISKLSPIKTKKSRKKTKKRMKITTLTKFLDETFQSTKKTEENKKDWKNLLIWGDNLYILKSLESQLKNKIQFIYIDPPFYTGEHEVIDIPIGETGQKTLKKGLSPIKNIAYQNIWVGSNPTFSFSQWFYERAVLMHKLLKRSGFMAVRFDYHYGHYAKMVLDEIFGNENFICEYLVRRMTKTVSDKSLANQKHLIVQQDNLYLYRKSANVNFFQKINKVNREYQDSIEVESGNDNIWIDIVGYEKNKRTLYPTENSEALLERIISLCSEENDIVADFFAGSGTTVAIAEKLKRRWVAADIGRYSINEIRKRILRNTNFSGYPFQVLNLEMFNKYILKNRLKSNQKVTEIYREYHLFILNAFGGDLLNNKDFIQGKKDEKYIHIGDIDSIISTREIKGAIQEVKSLGGKNLVILGWDYLMEANFFKKIMVEEEKIEVELLLIPDSLLRQTSSDHEFQKLPFLDFSTSINPSKREVKIEFQDFIPSNNIGEITNPFDFIDFWAIDWDYNEENLFFGRHFSQRILKTSGRRIEKNAKTEIKFEYPSAGDYIVLISVVDVFGNETSEYFEVNFR